MYHQNDIGFQLHNLSNMLRRRMERSGALSRMDDNVSRNNGWIIGYLADHSEQDVFQKDLENAFCIRRSTVSKVIRLMEEKGFIQRQAVPYDARLKKIVLTDEGRTLHEIIKKEQQATEQLLRQSVTEEELETFFRVVEKFKKNIE